MVASKTELEIDLKQKSTRSNKYRVLQAWKRLAEVKLNEENQGLKDRHERLLDELWELKKEIGDDDHPFIVEEDVEKVEKGGIP